MDELLLIAASGLAREVLAAVREGGRFDVIGILDDDAGRTGTIVDGARILGPASDALRYPEAGVVVCVGAGSGRARIVDRLAALGFPDRRYATVVDSFGPDPGRMQDRPRQRLAGPRHPDRRGHAW